VASLLYASPAAIDGPDLGSIARARIVLSKRFDPEGSAALSMSGLSPAPGEDPCYTALLGIPLVSNAEKDRYHHPLMIPCYVSPGAGTAENPIEGEVPAIDDFLSRLRCTGS